MNVAPTWFEQGRGDVNDLYLYVHTTHSPNLKGPNDRLCVASELWRRDNAILKWLDNTKASMLLLAGILSIVQPELYETGRLGLEKLFNSRELVNRPVELMLALEVWWTPFTAMTVVSNRETPLHRDMAGRVDWVDMLLALGEYEHGRFSFPGLGIVYRYNPGTILAFSGKALQHGATCPGNRACIALYMRDNVIKRLKVPTPTWLNISGYAVKRNSP
jgi:hypothetical protein